MSYQLNFTVVNAAITPLNVPIEIDGASATASLNRCVIEAAPTDRAGKTLTLVLPTDALDAFPDGTLITITAEPAPSTSTQEA